MGQWGWTRSCKEIQEREEGNTIGSSVRAKKVAFRGRKKERSDNRI